MTTYTIFQCSVCRRIKDVPQDNVRAVPNQCIITKGCSGSLFAIGTTNTLTNTPAVAGLTDWYPRGQVRSTATLSPGEVTAPLSTSTSKVLTLALYVDDGTAIDNTAVQVRFQQRSTQDIAYSQYNFTLSAATSAISGKDSSGKNLRFDQSAIDQARVFVLVNGVGRFPGTGPLDTVLTPGVVGFNAPLPAGTVVSISVFTQPTTVERTLNFVLNNSLAVSASSGAWGNVRWAREYDVTGTLKPNKWWLYSCTAIAGITPSSRLQLLSVTSSANQPIAALTDLSQVRFLLAAEPYDNTDRYLNFYASASLMAADYVTVSGPASPTELTVDSTVIIESYPPLVLSPGAGSSTASFVSADTFSTTDAATAAARLTGTKILGPV